MSQNLGEASKAPGQIQIFGNDKLSDRVNLFQQRAAQQEEKAKRNPFSSKFQAPASSGGDGSVTSVGLSKDDPRYGRPPEGSKTEMRGIKAHCHIGKEVVELCNIIRTWGEPQRDGSFLISFGELFQMYTVISNKVVGILLRARKHGLLTFEGEMLFQRRDDNKVIRLFPVKRTKIKPTKKWIWTMNL